MEGCGHGKDAALGRGTAGGCGHEGGAGSGVRAGKDARGGNGAGGDLEVRGRWSGRTAVGRGCTVARFFGYI
jgi:hypothetical protein